MVDLKKIEEIMRNGAAEERQTAVRELSEYVNPESHKLLLKCLDDENHIVRLFAITALGRYPSESTVSRLFNMLENSEEEDDIVRESIRSTLMNLCLQAPCATIQHFKKSQSKEIRLFLVDIIASIGTPEAISALKRMAADSDDDVRTQALAYLGALGDDDVASILIDNLNAKDSMAKIAAIQALGRLKVKNAVPDLIAILDQDMGAVTFNVLLALGEIGDERAIQPLVDFLNVRHLTLRHTAIDSLVKMGAPAVGKLVPLLSDTNHDLRILAANTLGNIRQPSAVESLIKAMNDGNPNVRYAALEALDRIEDPRTFGCFQKALDDPSRDVVCMAIRALARIGGAEVTAALTSRLLNNEEEIQFFILEALTEMNAKIPAHVHEQFKNSCGNDILLQMAETLVAKN